MPFPSDSQGIAWNRKNIESMSSGQKGVYGIFNATYWIYIGQADDMKARLLEHYDKTSDQSACIWRHTPTGFKTMLATSLNIYSTEEGLIKEYNPVCNKT